MNTEKSWSEKRVLVTGATGLVGSSLVKKLLDSGANVIAFVRDADPQSELIRRGTIKQTSVVQGRLEVYADLERAINEHEVDTVFHLGAQAIVGSALRNPLATFESNIRGTYNLLEACRVHTDLVKCVVVASSDKAYGDSDELPYTELMPPLGRHPYDVSKSCTDLIAQSYAITYELPVAIARCGNIFGGGDLNWSRIIPGTILSLHKGERPVIRSDGKFGRDYVYIDDAVSAYLSLAEAVDKPDVGGNAFNFGSETPTSVIDIVDQLRNLMDREDLSADIRNSAKAEIRDQYLSTVKARETLNWAPNFSLIQGLKETVSWYRNFFLNSEKYH